LHHIDNIYVVKHLYSSLTGLRQQVTGELVFSNQHHIAYFLRQIDHFVGLQSLSMQPAHVKYQHLAQLIGRKAPLG